MNVLLVASRLGVAPAEVVLEAVAQPWRDRAEVESVPVSDGVGDLCEVMAFYTGAELGTLDVGGDPVPVLVGDDEWIVDLSSSWGPDSGTLGRVLAAVLEEAPRRLTVNLPVRVIPDLGRAMMSSLGAATVRDVADRLADIDLVVTAASEQALLGVNGLPRWLDRHGVMSAAAAQELERELGANLPTPARRQLLGAPVDAKSPSSGVGGGASLVLQAAGARFAWAGDIVAGAIVPRLADADLVVYVTGEIELDLPRSLFTISERAGQDGTPVIVVYGEGRLLRHELARFGLSGSYSYAAQGTDLAAVTRAMVPISQTWAR